MRAFNLTPHIAQNATRRRSAIDGRTTHHSGYEISQQKRKRVETVRLGQDHRRASPANCFYRKCHPVWRETANRVILSPDMGRLQKEGCSLPSEAPPRWR